MEYKFGTPAKHIEERQQLMLGVSLFKVLDERYLTEAGVLEIYASKELMILACDRQVDRQTDRVLYYS